MTKDFLYWFFLLLWVLFGGWYGTYMEPGPRRFGWFGGNLVGLILFFLIGLAVFGNPIK